MDHGFPETLNYVVWCLTMIPPAWIALRRAGVRLQTDRRSVMLGLAAGMLGAGLETADLRGARLDADALVQARLAGARIDVDTAIRYAAANGLRVDPNEAG